MVKLTVQECEALYDLLKQLSGGKPESVFAWEGKDDPRDPLTLACAKVYTMAGAETPEEPVELARLRERIRLGMEE